MGANILIQEMNEAKRRNNLMDGSTKTN